MAMSQMGYVPIFMRSESGYKNYMDMEKRQSNQMGFASILMRSESGFNYTDMEKRQLFLRSYQFSRKQSLTEKIKKTFFRVKKVIRVRFRSARKLRKIVWLRLKRGIYHFSYRKRRFLRLYNNPACFC